MSDPKTCGICESVVTKQHWARHLKTKKHKEVEEKLRTGVQQGKTKEREQEKEWIKEKEERDKKSYERFCEMIDRVDKELEEEERTTTTVPVYTKMPVKEAVQALLNRKKEPETPPKTEKRIENPPENKPTITQEMPLSRRHILNAVRPHLPIEPVVAGDNSRVAQQINDQIYRVIRQFPALNNEPAFIEVMFRYQPESRSVVYTVFAEYHEGCGWVWSE